MTVETDPLFPPWDTILSQKKRTQDILCFIIYKTYISFLIKYILESLLVDLLFFPCATCFLHSYCIQFVIITFRSLIHENVENLINGVF